ncbi:MAG: hypothetical protein KatS3mg005_1781 [Bryobacteraceae bacterium]|nr:MAG: hypothetical protein KatS3mg005_1781 [Bryobacteraceae bacterium]
MRPEYSAETPDILVAVYSRLFRLVWSAMVGMATAIIIGAAVADAPAPSTTEPIFTIVATGYILLAGGFLLSIWRSRVSFKEEGMLITRPLKSAIWRTYDDIAAIELTAERVDLRFSDGSKASINRHMADLSQIQSLLAAKARGR